MFINIDIKMCILFNIKLILFSLIKISKDILLKETLK